MKYEGGRLFRHFLYFQLFYLKRNTCSRQQPSANSVLYTIYRRKIYGDYYTILLDCFNDYLKGKKLHFAKKKAI